MKTDNSFYISVIIRPTDVIVGTELTYEDAKETLIHTLRDSFDIEADEAFIFKGSGAGAGLAVFNYRAHLSGEEDGYVPSAKENKHMKLWFRCPICKSSGYLLVKDEDNDFVCSCKTEGCEGAVVIQ